MKRSVTVLLLSAMLVSEANLLAQDAPASTTLVVRSTIATYDASRRTLSLSTSSGTVRFPVTATTRISQSGHTVNASELQKLAGYHATVRYTESGSSTIVESIHVFGK